MGAHDLPPCLGPSAPPSPQLQVKTPKSTPPEVRSFALRGLIISCRRRDSNPYGGYPPWDFKSHVSANSTTPALGTNETRAHLRSGHTVVVPTAALYTGTGKENPDLTRWGFRTMVKEIHEL